MKHLLQSAEWAAYQILEGKQVFGCKNGEWQKIDEKTDEKVLKKENFEIFAWKNSTPVGDYLMVAYGPDAENERELERKIGDLKKIAEQENAFFVRVEPTLAISEEKMEKIAKNQGISAVKGKEIDPEHTWVLDLDCSREELLAGMESNKVRSWRNCAKKGMTVRTTKNPEEISILSKMLAGVGERDHFTPQDENHLKNQMKAGFATLYVVEIPENEAGGSGADDLGSDDSSKSGGSDESGVEIPIAASLIYDFEGVRYYAHAATDDNYRKLRAGAVLLVQTIVDVQENGGKIYDFWGITTSEDKNHPWYGFTQYKKSFGGRQVDYAGTYDLVISGGKYKLYKGLRKGNLAVRKIFK